MNQLEIISTLRHVSTLCLLAYFGAWINLWQILSKNTLWKSFTVLNVSSPITIFIWIQQGYFRKRRCCSFCSCHTVKMIPHFLTPSVCYLSSCLSRSWADTTSRKDAEICTPIRTFPKAVISGLLRESCQLSRSELSIMSGLWGTHGKSDMPPAVSSPGTECCWWHKNFFSRWAFRWGTSADILTIACDTGSRRPNKSILDPDLQNPLSVRPEWLVGRETDKGSWLFRLTGNGQLWGHREILPS